MSNISIDDFADEIASELEAYSQELQENFDEAVDIVGKECVDNLKESSPAQTGEYAKGWRRKKYKHRQVVYNGKKPWATAPLEYGHAKKGGGRVEAVPHIKKCEEIAQEDLENLFVSIVSEGVRLK